MNNLMMNFNILAPMILLVLIGKILFKYKLINNNFVDISSNVVFKITLPTTLFISTSKIKLDNGISSNILDFLLYGTIIMVLSFAIMTIVSFRLNIPKHSKGSFIQGTCRSNFAIIGYPILLKLFGEKAILPMSVFTIFLIGITNGFSTIILTLFSSEDKNLDLKRLVKNIIFNPLIDSLILGFLFSFYSMRIPVFLESTLSQVSNLTTPLALINIGTIFNISSELNKLKPLAYSVLFKNIIIPLVTTLIAIKLGFRDVLLGILFIAFASPTPPSSFIMAKLMNSDYELAANIIIISTAISAFVILFGVSLMQYMSLI